MEQLRTLYKEGSGAMHLLLLLSIHATYSSVAPGWTGDIHVALR